MSDSRTLSRTSLYINIEIEHFHKFVPVTPDSFLYNHKIIHKIVAHLRSLFRQEDKPHSYVDGST